MPKVNGVNRTSKLSICLILILQNNIDEHSVESGVSATPLSIEELIDGGKLER